MLFFFLSNCGKKMRSVRSFNDKVERQSVSLLLPAPKLLLLEGNKRNGLRFIACIKVNRFVLLQGYQLYGVTSCGAVIHEPRAFIQPNRELYFDKEEDLPAGYCIRALFRNKERALDQVGPLSNILMR